MFNLISSYRLISKSCLLLFIGLNWMGCQPVNRDDSVFSEAYLNEFDIDNLVELHNELRDSYEVPPVSWSIDLATEAGIWALQLADTGCIGYTSEDTLYGEIVYDSVPPLDEEEVFDIWASEEASYDTITHTCDANESCDRFTQITWFETEFIGCAQAICPDDAGEIWVCKYDPPGNEEGVEPF